MSCNAVVRIYNGAINECSCEYSDVQLVPGEAFEDVNIPTNGELTTWYFGAGLVDIQPNTLFIFINNGTLQEPDFAWLIDQNGDFTLIHTPGSQDSLVISQWVAVSGDFTDVNDPQIAEIQVVVNANSLAPNTFITYKGTATQPDYVWVVIENDDVVQVKTPNNITAVVIPNEEFVESWNPEQAELLTYAENNNLDTIGNVFIVAGNGSINEPDNSYVLLTGSNFAKLNTYNPAFVVYNIPSGSFSDTSNPTITEVNDYISGLGATLNNGDVAYLIGSGTSSNPDFMWMAWGGTILRTKSPSSGSGGVGTVDYVEVPIGTFLNPEIPTLLEITTWVDDNGPFNAGTYLCYYGSGTAYKPQYIWMINSSAELLFLTKTRLDYTVLSATANPNEIEISYPNGSSDVIVVSSSTDVSALENSLEIMRNQLTTLSSLMAQLVQCQCGLSTAGTVDIGITMNQTGVTLEVAELEVVGGWSPD